MSRRIALTALAVAALAGGCYEDDGSGPATSKPLAKVLMTDAPFPFDTVQSVNVYVVSVAVSASADTSALPPPGGMQWVTITEPRQRINLLTLQQGTTALLGEGEIPANQYRAVRVIIDTDSSEIHFTDGSAALVHWGGAGQQAIHAFVEAAVAVPEEGAEIVIDFDVGRSFHYNDFGDRSFSFVPWIRAVNKAATGSIAGTVRADTGAGTPVPIANATVTAYGASQTTSWFVSTGRTDDQGHYRLAYLLPGAYIVQTNAPRSGGWTTAYDSSVAVTRGVETDHDVTLAQFRGALFILGASSMLVNRTNQLEAMVVNSQNQRVVDPVVTWENLNPTTLSLQATTNDTASVTSLAVGSGRVVATSGGFSDTLTIFVAPDSSQGTATLGRIRRR